MKNLLAYTPEPFENLEIMDAEYDVLTGEGEMDEGEVRRRNRRRPARATTSRMGRPRFPMRRPKYPVSSAPSASGGGASSSGSTVMPTDNDRSFGQHGSERVRWAQDCLNRILDLRLIVDGIMNRETRSAVRMFQERKGLPVTGLVGPDTEEALRAEGEQAAEPELLEGEWEMPDSGECSCGGREREEFAFEVEPFGGVEFGELESESTPPVAAPRVLTYTTKDVIDKRISVPAQHSLVRLSKNPATSADALGLLEAVKSGRLLGIWCVNWKASSDRAQQHGSTWGNVIPKGEDAVLMLDPINPLTGAPLIAFRRTLDTRPDKGCGMLPKETTPSYFPQRLDAALIRIWKAYTKLNSGAIVLCSAGLQPSGEPTVPATCLAASSPVSVYPCPQTVSPDFNKCLQVSLNRIMGLSLPVDGIFGTQTKSALKSFQKKANLIPNGFFDKKTKNAMHIAGAPVTTCQPPPPNIRETDFPIITSTGQASFSANIKQFSVNSGWFCQQFIQGSFGWFFTYTLTFPVGIEHGKWRTGFVQNLISDKFEAVYGFNRKIIKKQYAIIGPMLDIPDGSATSPFFDATPESHSNVIYRNDNSHTVTGNNNTEKIFNAFYKDIVGFKIDLRLNNDFNMPLTHVKREVIFKTFLVSIGPSGHKVVLHGISEEIKVTTQMTGSCNIGSPLPNCRWQPATTSILPTGNNRPQFCVAHLINPRQTLIKLSGQTANQASRSELLKLGITNACIRKA